MMPAENELPQSNTAAKDYQNDGTVLGQNVQEVSIKKIKVEVSPDGYEAFVTANGSDLQPTDVQAALEANGVIYGIDSNAVFEGLSRPGNRVLVAAGTRHTDGKDAWLEITKNHQESRAEAKLGITNTNVGEVVAIIHKPTAGSVGIDVYGKKVEPKQGKNINIFAGPYLKRTETSELITFEANVDGNLRVTSSSIEIEPEHIIRGDVDSAVGEIEFAGALKIYGDVKGGARLKTNHDVFIQGSVEDAEIISGGNVTVKGSFVGRGDGLIKATGNVEVHVVLNQMIKAGGSINIVKESVNAHLIADNEVYGQFAIIMGGTITAANKIEVHTLGGELYSTTKVRLGMHDPISDDSQTIDKEIETQAKSAEALKSQIYLLVRDRIDGNNFTSEKASQLKLLQSKLQQLTVVTKQLAEKKEQASLEMNRKKSPKLIVTGTIHQNVIAEINGVRLALKQSFNNVEFEESKGEIVRSKNLG